MAEAVSFPEDFTWGAATASYQIEGGVDEGGRGRSIWDTFSHTPGKTLDGDTGDVACDHYHRVPEDVGLLADLGASHYRFSIAWPRIQPDGRGAVNPEGVDFYSRLVDTLLDRGVQPWVTLYHWDLPQALEDAGGWPVRDTAYRFAEYAAAIHEQLRDRVSSWTTLNEPWCSSLLGYGSGKHAPGRTDDADAVAAVHHLLLGHGLAVQAMRDVAPDQSYGITLNLYPVDPATDSEADRDAARRIDGVHNRLFLDPVLRGSYPQDVLDDFVTAGIGTAPDLRQDGDLEVISAPLDFLGVNYYTRHVVRAGAKERAGEPTMWTGSGDVEPVFRGVALTDMGWEIDPDGLYEVLSRVGEEYRAPALYVTENGAAFPDPVGPDGVVDDQDRIAYLDGHFRAAHRARERGVDLRGYFVWSLMDNFEWSLGYSKRFGLVHVDYETLKRTPKASARWYAEVIRRNGLAAGDAQGATADAALDA